jgi:hypothetical protein
MGLYATISLGWLPSLRGADVIVRPGGANSRLFPLASPMNYRYPIEIFRYLFSRFL